MFEITIRCTSIIVGNGKLALDLLTPLFNMLTYEDEYVEETKTLGFLYDEQSDRIFLHKGVDLEYVVKLLGGLNECKIVYDDKYVGENMSYEFEEVIAPRSDEQSDVIDFVCGRNGHCNNVNEHQLFLVLGTGKGKTFCSGYGIGEYGKKALIIMHRDSLRSQWLESLYKMNGFTSSYVHEIDSAEELYDIANGTYKGDYDIYLMTHATFRAGMKRIGTLEKAMNITKNLGIGIKVIDEAHLEFKDTILMDMVFNVYRNLYLTATDGRSSKEENSIFRHVFANACYYKQSDFVGDDNRPKKWVNYYGIEVNTNCPKNLYKYKVVGFKSMTPSSYGKWVIQRDKNKTHFKCCTEIIHNMFMEDQYAKVLVFMPLIDLCEEFAYHLNMALQKDPSFPYDVDVRTINSKNSPRENERNKSADVIVTTIGSCGTGTDIPGITGIVSCSPFCSSITCRQVFGRIRYCGKIGSYYDICDSSVPMDRYWYQSRSKTLKRLALNVKELRWVDDTQNGNNTIEE